MALVKTVWDVRLIGPAGPALLVRATLVTSSCWS